MVAQMSWIGFLEDAVCRRIGDHQAGEGGSVLCCLGSEISKVDVCPLSSQSTTTTICKPHICAVAGLVPCAELRNQADVALAYRHGWRDSA
jgi:hypothetical protein